MNWKKGWNWENCPVWFIHTGIQKHKWKKDSINFLIKSGILWGNETENTEIVFSKDWLGEFGGQFWPACVGQSEPYWDSYQSYSKTPLGGHPMEFYLGRKAIRNEGAWGYLHTWIEIIEQAIEKKYPMIWIFDDDIRPHMEFKNKVNMFHTIQKHNPKWKIILWGASQQDGFSPSNTDSYQPNQKTDGSFSVMIHHTVYFQLLQLLHRKIAPVDTGTLTEIYRIYPKDCYVINPHMIMADVTTGDISLPVPLHMIKWNIRNYFFEIFQRSIVNDSLYIQLIPFQDKMPNQQQYNMVEFLKKLPQWVIFVDHQYQGKGNVFYHLQIQKYWPHEVFDMHKFWYHFCKHQEIWVPLENGFGLHFS